MHADSKLLHEVDLAPEERNHVIPQPRQRWYQRPRTRQIFAVVGVLVFVGVLLTLTAIYSSMGKDNNQNNGNTDGNMKMFVAQCNHPVYCTGDLLREVQLAKLYSDNKEFVDMPSRTPIPYLLGNFSALFKTKASLVSSGTWKTELQKFVDANFYPVGSDVYDAGTPPDYKDNFPLRNNITDLALQNFSTAVHRKWKNLYRAFNSTGTFCENCSSALPTPYPFIVPGGRFREMYLWDEFWIIKGLLVSGLFDTARKTILNFISFINSSPFGLAPNGARVYYTDRSQPPLVAWMVDEYARATGDDSLILQALPTLDREHDFWMNYRTPQKINYYIAKNGAPTTTQKTRSGRPLLLSQYFSTINAPRPESYTVDEETKVAAKNAGRRPDVDTATGSASIFSNLRAGAETGWDYSSRWFENGMNITSIDTNNIAPVDLNAILVRNEQLLQSWFTDKAGKGTSSYSPQDALKKADMYRQNWQDRQDSMFALMWDNTTSSFFDYDLRGTAVRRANGNYNVYASLATAISVPSIAATIENYGQANQATAVLKQLVLSAGVATSNVSEKLTGQQWDGHNSWAPCDYFMEAALENLGDTASASGVAQRWVSTTWCGWNATTNMFEKYDAAAFGVSGQGGEYTPQSGFGWTNGLTLFWLGKYSKSLVVPGVC